MATTTGARTVIGLFDSHEDAERALRELRDAGVRGEDISLVASDFRGNYTTESGTGTTKETGTIGEHIAGGALFGGLGGLLIGLAALAIPGVGPVVAAGPLATTLAGAGLGAVGGGIIGAIRDAGVPEEEAHIYAESVRRGGTLVSVRGTNLSEDRIVEIMDRNGAVDVEQRGAEYRKTGWNRFDENATTNKPVYSGSPRNEMGGTPLTGPRGGSVTGTTTGSDGGTLGSTGQSSTGSIVMGTRGSTTMNAREREELRRRSRVYYR